MTESIPYMLFAHCIPVKGAERSTICDLQRNKIHLIPNAMFYLLQETQGQTISQIKADYSNESDDFLDEYFLFLDKEELIFFTQRPALFPEMSMQWHSPSAITNAIIDINRETDYDFAKASEELDKLGCKFVEIRCYQTIGLARYHQLLKCFEDTTIVSIVLIAPVEQDVTDMHWNEFCNNYKRITNLVLHNSPIEQIFVSTKTLSPITYIKKEIGNQGCCGVINMDYFTANTETFTESQHHNSCLNRKISIDVNGDIKNCPSMPESYGNIKDTSLTEVIDKPGFKKYWNLTKDQVSKCKDCEFRHICTDCRAYVDNPEDIYSAPLKCGYNPYTCEWEEWSTHQLKQEAIEYYKM